MEESTIQDPAAEHSDPSVDQASAPFVGQWNRLVSTTNWEKGKIITEWRDALIASGAPSTIYSDEAWTRRVGGVTGQHVGRLRRVFQRFGGVYSDYTGLYWSHFHAAVDWEDAEMWLEGALQSGWSVSQMRTTRWTTLGGTDVQPIDAEIVLAELDEDFEPAQNDPPANSATRETSPTDEQIVGEVAELAELDADEDEQTGAAIYADDDPDQTVDFVRPFENLGELPEDLAQAFEDFKLAILRHKSDEWEHISQEEVLASLDALKELAKAPSADSPL